MPYIKGDRRPVFDDTIEELVDKLYATGLVGGDLNYIISRLLFRFTQKRGISYETIAIVEHAAEGALKEFTRKVSEPYEDSKEAENGEVFV